VADTRVARAIDLPIQAAGLAPQPLTEVR